ncbi:hypothetical protein MAC_03610 [Metarhizium acridum CQMa 102]|uniref:Uncharacterized protein n=1 Tax=Metarhizium acridum (strain CQMa 102) TaxID=655827 RepID=E9E162_METAQ|nr:uncharacterized protein MAC_03610 [Metarhizium acridum CQMa 102]EFY90364.1 hypothetical protein MAC_03610 [Metarhizium acridum CQMa 102]
MPTRSKRASPPNIKKPNPTCKQHNPIPAKWLSLMAPQPNIILPEPRINRVPRPRLPQLLTAQMPRIHNPVHRHGAKHQGRIKNIQRPLMLQQIALLAHDVLHDPKHRPHQNQRARRVQHHHDPDPARAGVHARRRRPPPHPDVKNHSRHGKQPKHDDLHKQPAEDDVLSRLGVKVLARHHPPSRRLHHERQDVAQHKGLGEPADGDDGVALAVDAAHEPPERHVDGGGEERGRNEDEHRLHQVRAELVGVVARVRPGRVA